MEETLGKRIVQNRKRLGLTQDALAEKLGVTAQAVSKWENDQSCPDITTLPRLAEIFGITTDALLGLEAPAKVAEIVTEDVPGLHIDKNDNHWEFKWDGGRKSHLATALWVIGTALMLLAANYLNQDVGLWTALWTTGLTVFGIFGLWPRFSFFRFGCGLLGGYFIMDALWPRFFVLEKGYILPIFLLLFGLSLLFEAFRKKKEPVFRITSHGKNKQNTDYQVDGDSFDCDISFGTHSQLVELPLLRRGEAEVSFGELTLDLRGCEAFTEDCSLELDCNFGNLTVILPASLRAVPSSDTFSGKVRVSGQPDPDAQSIRVSCDASFGEIHIQYL